MRLNQGPRVRRQRGDVSNKLVEFQSETVDWAKARSLGLGAVIRPNLVTTTARRLGTRVRDLSERLENVRVRD